MISQATIGRLALYLRTLQTFQDQGIQVISSSELARKLNITPVQVRKDLALFGQFGMKGIGYFTSELSLYISKILGLHRHWHMAIVGVGHLGSALANYNNFPQLGFQLDALFDNDDDIIGTTVCGITVSNVKNLKLVVHKRNISIGVITVPASHAQSVANSLVNAGVNAIWNFAPVQLDLPSHIHLVNEDLSTSLCSLSYHLHNS